MTAVLKSKQTSIATVRKHLRTEASLLTPLPFHYPLPLMLNLAFAPSRGSTQLLEAKIRVGTFKCPKFVFYLQEASRLEPRRC
jgi:hypothetical protein